MSWLSHLFKPVNQALNSNAFKAAFPVQALVNKGVELGSGLTGINHGHGIQPAEQYAIGGGIGSILGGGAALMGGGAGQGAGAGAGTGAGAGSGAGAGAPSTAGAGASPISRYLQMMRPGGQQPPQQQLPPQTPLEKIYAMYPNLRPHMGGYPNGIR